MHDTDIVNQLEAIFLRAEIRNVVHERSATV